MSLYSDRDMTFEKLVDLLVRVTNERDEALKRCGDQNQQVFSLMTEMSDARSACDEWEKKNGDAPHRCVRLADRIRVNAGLSNPTSGTQP